MGSMNVSRGGCVVPHSQLVLDSAKGELVKAPATVVKKTATQAKALAALKNHSEAEKRRRQRINTHLSSLRGIVTADTHKMDKATLLGEVITHMKELQNKALETCQGLLLLPPDMEEVTIETLPAEENAFRVSLCFKDRQDVLLDLRKAIHALRLNIIKAEMSSFENWVKITVVFFTNNHESVKESAGGKMSSIHRALTSVLEKNSSLSSSSLNGDDSPGEGATRKRRRVHPVHHHCKSHACSCQY